MSSQAQIDANKRNASKSTGPKTEAGKARARLNALKDGSHARTVNPVLPQEDPIELAHRINQWIIDLDAQNDFQRELVATAATLAWEIDRARRCETARVARRVRQAQLKDSEQQQKEVGELARRLLYNTGPKIVPKRGQPSEDNPAAYLAGLEKSAEGCRWLLDRWAGLRTLLDHNLKWTNGDMFSLVRLLGKCPVEAITDPKLNAVLLAFDAVVPGWAERFWKECEERKPLRDPGFSDFGRWRVIAEKPADAVQGVKFFYDLMDEQVARLEELLELHEEIAGDDAADLADRVSSDDSAEGERLRRQQAAKSRELRQTIELLMKVQRAENTENHGQAAGDGAKVKQDDAAPTPTPAPAAVASREPQRETATASKPVSKKKSRDKQDLTAASEMEMLDRLTKQAFGKHFKYPPESLAELMGLPKFADLKVLPGRAPVQARRANESTTSEPGRKNANIEANGCDTQVDERQRDSGDYPDSCGKKRSQTRDEDSIGH